MLTDLAEPVFSIKTNGFGVVLPNAQPHDVPALVGEDIQHFRHNLLCYTTSMPSIQHIHTIEFGWSLSPMGVLRLWRP